MNPEWIGLVAGFFTTSAFVPQTLKVLRECHTKSISLGMYCMVTIGTILWFTYGFLIGSPSMMIANAIAFLLAVTILVMKIRCG